MFIYGNDNIIDKLLSGNDEIVFNLVALIRGQKGARLHSDGISYLTAQANANCPMWVYANAQADERTKEQLCCVFSQAMQDGGSLCVNAQEGFTEKTLQAFSDSLGKKLTKRNPLNAYYIKQVSPIAAVGNSVAAEQKHESVIAMLIKQASIDDCDGDMTDEQAMQFAKAHAGTGNLYLWVNDGKVVSMARIVRYGAKFARLTSIVTERAARGNGFAKMLVGELSTRLLAEGVTPVLYARSENNSSNRCYQNIGFEKAGQICEFRIE